MRVAVPVVHRAAVREKRLVCPPPTATFREPGSDLRVPLDNPSNQQNRAASGGRVGATAAVYSAAILGASISRPRLPDPRRFRKIAFITRPEKPEPDANLRPPLHPSDSDRVPHRRGSRARRQRLQGSQGAHPPTHASSRAYPNAVIRHRAVQRSQPFEKATARFEIPPRHGGGEARRIEPHPTLEHARTPPLVISHRSVQPLTRDVHPKRDRSSHHPRHLQSPSVVTRSSTPHQGDHRRRWCDPHIHKSLINKSSKKSDSIVGTGRARLSLPGTDRRLRFMRRRVASRRCARRPGFFHATRVRQGMGSRARRDATRALINERALCIIPRRYERSSVCA